MTLDERLTQVVPTARQILHQSTEFYAFVHFGMNTFTDREWNDGSESPDIFDPYAADGRVFWRLRSRGMTRTEYRTVNIDRLFLSSDRRYSVIYKKKYAKKLTATIFAAATSVRRF